MGGYASKYKEKKNIQSALWYVVEG
jgi:hypothetical protein